MTGSMSSRWSDSVIADQRGAGQRNGMSPLTCTDSIASAHQTSAKAASLLVTDSLPVRGTRVAAKQLVSHQMRPECGRTPHRLAQRSRSSGIPARRPYERGQSKCAEVPRCSSRKRKSMHALIHRPSTSSLHSARQGEDGARPRRCARMSQGGRYRHHV